MVSTEIQLLQNICNFWLYIEHQFINLFVALSILIIPVSINFLNRHWLHVICQVLKIQYKNKRLLFQEMYSPMEGNVQSNGRRWESWLFHICLASHEMLYIYAHKSYSLNLHCRYCNCYLSGDGSRLREMRWFTKHYIKNKQQIWGSNTSLWLKVHYLSIWSYVAISHKINMMHIFELIYLKHLE